MVACFATAIYMITNSYKEWQESPGSTTITTHPITELEFPTVTVCPPRGSNTALNHLLEKVKDVNYTEEERQLNMSKEVFIDIPNNEHATKMTELLTSGNIRSIMKGQTSMPEIDQQGIITIRSSELEGIFKTPGFGDSNYTRAVSSNSASSNSIRFLSNSWINILSLIYMPAQNKHGHKNV